MLPRDSECVELCLAIALHFGGLCGLLRSGSQMPRHLISGAHEWINEILSGVLQFQNVRLFLNQLIFGEFNASFAQKIVIFCRFD